MQAANMWIVGEVIGYVDRCARADETGKAFDWYALRVGPKCEARVSEKLTKRGYSPYYPLETRLAKLYSKASAAPQRVTHPIFAGYVFLAISGPPKWFEICQTPGVLGVVCIGRSPIRIPTVAVSDLMAYEAIGGFDFSRPAAPSTTNSAIRRGSKVILLAGAFDGYEGVVSRMPKSDDKPVDIEINLMGRIVTAKAPVDKIRAVA